MTRWKPDAPGRLQQAALELFRERGFEGTTVAEIAERAGLTERTFFRHFSDKREVLFAGGQWLEEGMTRAIRESPVALPPLEAIAAALDAIAEPFEERRAFARIRSAVIEANPSLQERERNKLASLAAAVAAALRERGASESTAQLASEMGITVFRIAFSRWVTEAGEPTLRDCMRAALDDLRAMAVSTMGTPPA
jgi:AcrR family transcriptional regulator